jgi:hypothetical protein
MRIQSDVAEKRLTLRKKCLHPHLWKAGYTGTELLEFAVAATFKLRQTIWWCALFNHVHGIHVP